MIYALCWTRPDDPCRRPLKWASDTHIGLARALFALYVGGVDVLAVDLAAVDR